MEMPCEARSGVGGRDPSTAAVLRFREAQPPLRMTRLARCCPLVLVATAEVVDEHLLYWLIVGHQDVADGVAADYVADFFG